MIWCYVPPYGKRYYINIESTVTNEQMLQLLIKYFKTFKSSNEIYHEGFVPFLNSNGVISNRISVRAMYTENVLCCDIFGENKD